MILITHDLGVVAETADDVMYAARIVERGPVRAIFNEPRHPIPGADGLPARLDVNVERLYQIRVSLPRCSSSRRLPLPPAMCAMPVCRERTAARTRSGRSRPFTGLPPRRGDAPRGWRCCTDHRRGGHMSEAGGNELLVVEDLKKHFPVTRGIIFQKEVATVKAVDGISFSLREGETLGIVGESGCGKSTLVRCILKLLEPTGAHLLRGTGDHASLAPRDAAAAQEHDDGVPGPVRVAQRPQAGRVHRRRVARAPRDRTPSERKRRVQELLEVVGLNPEHYNRFPHEFSGGQRQRIGVARALAVNPKLIFCDEPVSALDVSVQAQILNLLKDLQREFGLTYVFIAHDLNVVRHISDRVMVMYLGKAAELADRDELYTNPKHPYTGALLKAVPLPSPDAGRARKQVVLEGDVPNPINPPAACNFHPRCPRFQEGHCDVETPPLAPIGYDHLVACHYPLERWPMDITAQPTTAQAVESTR